MSLLPDTASFHERVQDLFVTFRGSGVSFSALDVELLDGWAAHDVPFEVVARGLRKAAEAALFDATKERARLRSLRGAKRHVDSELKRYLRHSAGRTQPTKSPQPPAHLARHKKLLAAIKKATAPTPPAWLARLKPPADYAQADREETLALLLLARALPWKARLALLHRARALVDDANVLTPGARSASLQFHRAALSRQAWRLPSL